MDVLLPVATVLFFVFLLAQAGGEAAERLGVPALVGEIAAGIVIANFAVGGFDLSTWLTLDPTSPAGVTNQQVLSALAEVGVIFLVFSVGLAVRPSQLIPALPLSARTALFGIIVPFAFGTVFLLVLEGTSNLLPALFVGTGLVVTSLTVTARFLNERRLLDTVEARVILGAAVIEDIAGVVLLTSLVGIAAGRIHGPIDLTIQVGVVVGFAVAFAAFLLYGAPRLVRRFAPRGPAAAGPGATTKEVSLILAILLCLGAAALAESFQLASIVGAFFAGVALAEFRDRLGLRSAFDALTTFLVPFFFVNIGLAVSAGDLVATWPLATGLTVLAVAGKLTAVGFESRKLDLGERLRVGAGLIARGEVGIIVAFAAYQVGVISADVYTALVVMAIATTIIGPVLLHRLFRGRSGAPDAPPAPAGADG
jgi:Kef-type K+ transport system membrane component KefB